MSNLSSNYCAKIDFICPIFHVHTNMAKKLLQINGNTFVKYICHNIYVLDKCIFLSDVTFLHTFTYCFINLLNKLPKQFIQKPRRTDHASMSISG